MNTKLAKHFYLLVLFLIIISCGKNDRPSYDAELVSYIDKFILDAENREVNLITDNLEAVIVDKITVGTDDCGAGYSNYMELGNPRIEIVKDCWQGLNELEREHLIFHELGHALLGKSHSNKKLPNGFTPGSMMCTECHPYTLYHEDSPLREFYLDELFNDDTLFPEFFDDKKLSKIIYADDSRQNLDDWEIFENDIVVQDKMELLSLESTLVNSQYLNRLSISTNGAFNVRTTILRRFNIIDFDECANIVATADIKTEGLRDGDFHLGLSLSGRNSEGDLTRTFFSSTKQSGFYAFDNVFNNFSVANYCIPSTTQVVTLSISFNAPYPSKIIIENVNVFLLE